MKRTDFRHLEPLRVRWAEIDAQGIVFNGHYLTYLDTAMNAVARIMGAAPPCSRRSVDDKDCRGSRCVRC